MWLSSQIAFAFWENNKGHYSNSKLHQYQLQISCSLFWLDRSDFLSSAVIKYSALPKSWVFCRKMNDEETGTSHTHSLTHTFTGNSHYLSPLTWSKQLQVSDAIPISTKPAGVEENWRVSTWSMRTEEALETWVWLPAACRMIYSVYSMCKHFLTCACTYTEADKHNHLT